MFSNLTVLENLKMGAYTRKDKQEINNSLEMVYERFPRLKERTRQLAGTLSGGEQQMLAMGRALMANPRILSLIHIYPEKRFRSSHMSRIAPTGCQDVKRPLWRF